MKKLLIGFLVLSLVLLSFTSCNSNAAIQALEDGVGTVSFAEMQAVALKELSAAVETKEKGDLYWSYTAVKKDGGGTTGAVEADVTKSWPVVSTALPTTDLSTARGVWKTGLTHTTDSYYQHVFSVGTWEFTLYAFLDPDGDVLPDPTANNYVYKGTATAAVAASTTQKVTVGVSPVAEDGICGSVQCTADVPTGFNSTFKIMWTIDGGTTWNEKDAILSDQTPGTYTAEVKVQKSNDSGATWTDYGLSSKISITVYRGLLTTISGTVSDQTGAVYFDVEMPTIVTGDATPATPAPATGTSPEMTPSANTSPLSKTGAGNATTSVSIPQGAIKDITATEGTNVQSQLTVGVSTVETSNSTFTAKDDSSSAIAAIACELKVKEGTGDFVGKTTFNSAVTVTTYIAKNLTSPKIYYDGTLEGKPIATEAGDVAIAAGVVDVYDHETGSSGSVLGSHLGYAKDTGKLVFTTTHFSTFHVESTDAAYIAAKNSAYNTIENAIAAVDNNGTIVLLRDVDENVTIPSGKVFTLDLNGKTLNGGKVSESPAIKNNGTLTITGNGTIKRDDNGSTAYYVIHNCYKMTIDDATVTNNTGYSGDKQASLIINDCSASSGKLTINNLKFEQQKFIVIKNDNGELEINGGTFSCAGLIGDSIISAVQNWGSCVINNGDFSGGLVVATYGCSSKMTINNGTFTNTTFWLWNYNGDEYNPEVEINGGTFVFNESKPIVFGANKSTAKSNEVVTVNAGSFSLNPCAYTPANKAVYKDGNLFKVEGYISDSWTHGQTIVGGTFDGASYDPSNFVASGYTAYSIGTNKWVVGPSEGSNFYVDKTKSIYKYYEDAMCAANGVELTAEYWTDNANYTYCTGSIVLLKDMEIRQKPDDGQSKHEFICSKTSSAFYFLGNMTIDLNGHTLTNSNVTTTQLGNDVKVCSLTLNNGTWTNNGNQIEVWGNATLTLNNVTNASAVGDGTWGGSIVINN